MSSCDAEGRCYQYTPPTSNTIELKGVLKPPQHGRDNPYYRLFNSLDNPYYRLFSTACTVGAAYLATKRHGQFKLGALSGALFFGPFALAYQAAMKK